MWAAVSRERLIAASRQYLRTGKKGLPAAVSLNLAAQVLAVDAGLKPALLYDCNTAGAEQMRLYLQTLLDAGYLNQPPSVLDVDGSVFILNTQHTTRRLENILLQKQVTVMDVSPSRSQPAVADADVTRAVEGLLTVFVDYLKNLNWGDKPGVALSVRLAEEVTSRWNLCTLFGLLLGYPAAYWFDKERSFENCLSMTPLRVTAVSASCPLITGEPPVRLYSFTIPEALGTETQGLMDTWTQDLEDQFRQQSVFTHLSINTETVALPAVAL
ncbi:hypothetical protein AOXY_G30825 [Acipenser oxyrinchus oxyrinchus]|uniref:Uncharacterized protein n=1 Tax=Acipenser oxyrinchus oxyrinchus TaxID=40147 RepID=A0AAD8CMB7_ACIOX|nr:hypothetical protein AOXY_G30825 [Acipenser oxyrinchus oxyrinchus]